MKTIAIKTALGVCGLLAAAASPAFAVVNDNFESYTVGQNADMANPSVYTGIGANPLGVISAGTATANVASSNVLQFDASAAAGNHGTRINGSDIVGSANISFDFNISSGTSNIYFDDSTTNFEGGLIRFIEAGSGAPTSFFIRANGIDFALVEYGDWYNVSLDLVVDASGADFYSITVTNLTTSSPVTTFGATAGATTHDVDRINRLQVEAQAGSYLQLDNISVPEPGSLSLIALGSLAVLVRRRCPQA